MYHCSAWCDLYVLDVLLFDPKKYPVYILGLERIPDYPDNYQRTEHPDLFLCIRVLV